jgi:hypothetical protein
MIAIAALLAGILIGAAATPLPVHVENFPGPDKVAVDTLVWAKLSFWATVALGIPALFFGVVDYALNMQHFRRPKLSLSFPDEAIDLHRRFQPYSYDGDGRNFSFNVLTQLENTGKRAAKGCYVSFWIPASLTFESAAGWKPMMYSLESQVSVEYHRIETFVDSPVFVDHPVLLPAFSMTSKNGPVDFKLYWQVFDELGQYPERAPQTVYTGVASPR